VLIGLPFHPALAFQRLLERSYVSVVVGPGVLGRTLLNPSLLVRRQLALHFFNDQRKAGSASASMGIADFSRFPRPKLPVFEHP